MLFYFFIKMEKKIKIKGQEVLCREVPYYNGSDYSVAVYVNDEYVGQIDKITLGHHNFESRLKQFVEENA